MQQLSLVIMSTASAGVIAVIMETVALGVGLLIAGNVQALVSLNARRQLYLRGYATLLDAMWGVSVMDGLWNPRLLLRDRRSALAFFLGASVLFLEALTVLQTQPGENCDFAKPSSWIIQQQNLMCRSSDLKAGDEVRADASANFISRARLALRDADVDTGVPYETDVFERSILTKTAVEGVRPMEKIYDAPLRAWSSVSPSLGYIFTAQGLLSMTSMSAEDRDVPFYYRNTNAPFFFLGHRVMNSTSGEVEATGFVAVGHHFTVCIFGEKRRSTFPFPIFNNIYFGGNIPGRPIAIDKSFRSVNLTCDAYNLSIHGTQDNFSTPLGGLFIPRPDVNELNVASILASDYEAGMDLPSLRKLLRRSLLISHVAVNSANQEPCKRYIASPKSCTQIGWVSVMAVLALIAILVGTSAIRMALAYQVRSSIDWSRDERRVVESIFNCFDPEPAGYQSSRRSLKRRRERKHEINFNVSLSREADNYDLCSLEWTRDQVA